MTPIPTYQPSYNLIRFPQQQAAGFVWEKKIEQGCKKEAEKGKPQQSEFIITQYFFLAKYTCVCVAVTDRKKNIQGTGRKRENKKTIKAF